MRLAVCKGGSDSRPIQNDQRDLLQSTAPLNSSGLLLALRGRSEHDGGDGEGGARLWQLPGGQRLSNEDFIEASDGEETRLGEALMDVSSTCSREDARHEHI